LDAAGIARILEAVGQWPAVTVLALVLLGPWMVLVALHWLQARQIHAMKKMYEENAALVARTTDLACGFRDIVVSNTAAVTALNELLRYRRHGD